VFKTVSSITLIALESGRVDGRIREKGTPLTNTVTVVATGLLVPIFAVVDPDGGAFPCLVCLIFLFGVE